MRPCVLVIAMTYFAIRHCILGSHGKLFLWLPIYCADLKFEDLCDLGKEEKAQFLLMLHIRFANATQVFLCKSN